LLDSLLFNAPIMYLYLRHVLTHPWTYFGHRWAQM